MKPIMETVLAGFASIYPPYIWIPASAGVTQGGLACTNSQLMSVDNQPSNP